MNKFKKIDLIFSAVLYFSGLSYMCFIGDNIKNTYSFFIIASFSYFLLFFSLKKNNSLIHKDILEKLSNAEISLMLRNSKLKEVEFRLFSAIAIFISGLLYGFCFSIYMLDFYKNFSTYQQLNLEEVQIFVNLNEQTSFILNIIPVLFMIIYGLLKLSKTLQKPQLQQLNEELIRREKEA